MAGTQPQRGAPGMGRARVPLKMSIATKWHLAWPCLPVLDEVTSETFARQHNEATLSGRA